MNISTQYDRLEQTQNVVDVLAETRCKIEGIYCNPTNGLLT